MSTSKLVIIFIVAIGVVGTASFLLLPKSPLPLRQKDVPKAPQPDSKTIAVTDQVVIYNGKTFAPNNLSLKKGSKINFTNSSNQKIVVEVDGTKASPLVSIEPNAASTLILQEDGKYSFKEVSEMINKAKNQQGVKSVLPTTTNK